MRENPLPRSWPAAMVWAKPPLTLLPDLLDCREFVNADKIARAFSPFQLEMVSI
ncbi:hypothetical protein IC235_21750 [Hymenobacter sp. BT664]|uniref:Uncharacterized protein n=1 Tax=Hymenobacter montanus TaxID=2771359 RepID=A0A927BII8_9BACT|nr:hypothetical protein [Hymenobacter montanus]MBD2770518.1 hypothetical protein [Hymenobacter montanus]